MGDKPIPPPPLLLSEIDNGSGGGCWDKEDPSSELYLALLRERRQHPDDAPTIAEDDARLPLLLQELRRRVGGKKNVTAGLGGRGILSSGYANVAIGGGEGRGVRIARVAPPSAIGGQAVKVGCRAVKVVGGRIPLFLLMIKLTSPISVTTARISTCVAVLVVVSIDASVSILTKS